MELKFEVNEQEIVDKVLEIVKDEFIPKSVIEGIKAEINEVRKNALGYPNWEYAKGLETTLNIIDNHISGKEKGGQDLARSGKDL